ncbi:Alanine--tRNA ligase [Bienertia sinuspersici]
MGDFNCVMHMEERIGSIVRANKMQDMSTYLEDCGIQDLPQGGVLANDKWVDHFPKATTLFMTEGISNHCLAILILDNSIREGKRLFKYFRMWQQPKDLKQKLNLVWCRQQNGIAMYRLSTKLKQVKAVLKALNQECFNAIQEEDDPHNQDLAKAEKEAREDQKHEVCMQFLKQKAKEIWLREGDANTAMFHRSIGKRRLSNIIHAIHNQQRCC